MYLSILQVNSLVDEGLGCIKKYDDLLDEIAKLMFYAKFQLYEEGYSLCKTVCESYYIDEFVEFSDYSELAKEYLIKKCLARLINNKNNIQKIVEGR